MRQMGIIEIVCNFQTDKLCILTNGSSYIMTTAVYKYTIYQAKQIFLIIYDTLITGLGENIFFGYKKTVSLYFWSGSWSKGENHSFIPPDRLGS